MERKAGATVTLACSLASVQVPIPKIEIGWWEGVGLTWRGFIDRRGNRHVVDTTHTHTLHMLERRNRRMETEVSRKVDTLISPLKVRIAQLNVATADPIADPTKHPGTHELAELRGRDRFDWADQWREATEARKQHAAQQACFLAAKTEVASLHEEWDNVLTEGDDIRLQWREAHMLRAARYTRARFGFWGPRAADEPSISEYNFAEGPRHHRTTDYGGENPGIG